MSNQNRVNQLISEAAEWRMISLLFECPVGEWHRDVEGLAGEVADPDLRKAAEWARSQAGEGLYHAIFGPGGPAPAREISYRDWVQPGYLLSELSAYYQAFAYSPKTGEVPDHVAVEAGFVAYLKMKEAFALMCGEKENAELTSKAAQTFLDDHLAKMSEQIAKSLSESEIDYLAIASETLFRRVGPDKDKKHSRVLPVLSDPDAEIDCAF